MVPPLAAPGVLLIARISFAARIVGSVNCQRGGTMQEPNSGRKKTYLIIIVVLLVILAATFLT